MGLKAYISDWAAWAPGLSSQSDWQNYFDGKLQLDFDVKPDVSSLPPMFRRRLSPLNRMIFAAASQLGDQSVLKECPVVFTSRHGELKLSLKLIKSIIAAGTLSPAGFSMSVHNSAPGLLSIQCQNTSAVTSIAAGEDSLKMGLIEAVAQVQDCEKVLLIFADETMPEIYSHFESSQKYPSCLLMTICKNKVNHVIDTDAECGFEYIVRYLTK